MDEFIVQLLAKLDTNKVIQDYDNLKTQLEKEINIKVNLDTSSNNDVSKLAEQLQSALSKVSNGKLNLDISQITTALEQVIKNAQQAGEKTNNAFSRGVSSTVKKIKQEITSTINEISRLDANKIIENLNLNRASIGTDVTNQVRSLVSEINILGREVAKTGSDDSWKKLIDKCGELGNKLDSFGKIRSFPGMEDIKKFADYFDGKVISTGYKNSGLSGTDFNAIQLSKDLKNLGVQFSATKQEALSLDAVWEEMCFTTGRMDLLNITTAQDQLQTVISELQKAQSILNGEKGLVDHPNAHSAVSEYINAVTKARTVVEGYENEISNLTQKESQSSITSANTIVQNEEKKQQAYEQTLQQVKKQLLEGNSLIESGAGNTVDFKSITTAADEARNHFKNLLEDEKTVITTLKHFNGNELDAFTVNVKRASGEVESLNYKVKDSQILFDSGKINDTSAIKQIEQVEKKYTEFLNKLNDLKSKLTGTNFNYSSFDKMLEKFHDDEITVNELSTAFNKLKNTAETSMKGLNSQSSSFNPIQQAQNNMRDLPSMLTALETGMNSLKDKTSLTDVSVQNLVSTYNSLKSEMDAVGGKVPLTDEWITKYQNLMSTVASLTEQVKALKKVESSDNSAVKLTNQTNKIQLSIETGGYETKVESLIARTRQWTDGNARISTDALSKALDKLTTASNTLANNNTIENQQALIKAENELDVEIKKVTNSVRTMNATLAKDSTISSLHNQIQKFYDNNGAAHRKWGTQLKQMLSETASGAELTKERVTEIKAAFNGVASAAQQAGKVGKTWFQSLKDATKFLTYWTSPTFITMKAISEIKQGISTVKALDTALVDLKKTTTMTSSELEDFYYSSNKVAKQMGVTTEEIISQAAAWSRLGFSSAEAATKMAQLSSKFASISPGMSTDEAQEGLVSIIKAWGLDISDVEREVMDNINTLGNKFAESNIDLVNGMKRSAAALAATGTTYQDAFALFTGAQEVVQNAEVTGRALRSISMRMHGYSENSEDGLKIVDEELKNITGDLINLTKTAEHSQGVSMFKEGSNTEFKSFVEYFREINEIWSEMSQKQQNDYLDKAFGKNQAQAGAAIIQNYEAIEDAIEAMEDAAGSSEREMSVIMNSLDYKLNRLSETGTSVAQNLFKRDDMKTAVDSLTSVMNVIDSLTSKLGLFGSIGLGAGLFAGVKNIGKPI